MMRKFEVLRATLEESARPDEFSVLLVGVRGDALMQLAALDFSYQRHAAALDKYAVQQGIAVAMQSNSLAALIPLLLSVTTVSLVLGQAEDARSYADSGTQVAAAAINPFAYCGPA